MAAAEQFGVQVAGEVLGAAPPRVGDQVQDGGTRGLGGWHPPTLAQPAHRPQAFGEVHLRGGTPGTRGGTSRPKAGGELRSSDVARRTNRGRPLLLS
ncbi:hypothetical protein GCM10009663_40400 [Kitasatospora arboriphila]|uniref:Uncharacterized protein n=1 Tax=Kitasatospora arboriphila TaxID=258052 RepID=A0ABN1TL71_9ACTN